MNVSCVLCLICILPACRYEYSTANFMLFPACTFFTYGLYPVDKAFTSFLFNCFWLEIYFLKIDFSVQYYFIAYVVFNDWFFYTQANSSWCINFNNIIMRRYSAWNIYTRQRSQTESHQVKDSSKYLDFKDSGRY